MRIICKKRCIIFYVFYTVCFVLLFYCFYESKLSLYKYENCTVQDTNLYQTEQRLSKKVNTYFEKLYKNTSLVELKEPKKWTLMTTNMYAYSAFFEKCPSIIHYEYCVKFIAVTLSDISTVSPFTSDIRCVTKNGSSLYKSFAIVELLPEAHEKLFTTAYLYCPVSFQPSHAAFYNEFLNLTWVPVEKYVTLNYKNPETIQSHNISLCVRPLFDSLNYLQFSVFLAYYSLTGVDHFIFYYTKSFQSLQTFNSFLKFTNISHEILPWDIPLDNNLIHEYGQIAFVQDCISRSKNKFNHTIIVDLDEYIVPKKHKNIKTLMLYLDKQNPLSGSYVIPMALFCYEYPSDIIEESPFHILNHRKRQKTTWLHQYRSKYIIKPDKVKYSGIHFTWKLEENYNEIFVSPDVALISHFKFCCGMTQTWFLHLFQFRVLHDDFITDNSVFENKEELFNQPLLKYLRSTVL